MGAKLSVESMFYLLLSIIGIYTLFDAVGMVDYALGASLRSPEIAQIVIGFSMAFVFTSLYIFRIYGYSLFYKTPETERSDPETPFYLMLMISGLLMWLPLYIYILIEGIGIIGMPPNFSVIMGFGLLLFGVGWSLFQFKAAGISIQRRIEKMEFAPHSKEEWLYLLTFIFGILLAYGIIAYESSIGIDMNEYDQSQVVFLLFLIILSVASFVMYTLTREGMTRPTSTGGEGEGGRFEDEASIDEAITTIGQAISLGGGSRGGGAGGGAGVGVGGGGGEAAGAAAEGAKPTTRASGMSKTKRINYPFTAIVEQDVMKKALILNAINPEIGGVLIRGQKGTAKSTAVRGLAEIMPNIQVVEGCRFSCDPEDRKRLCWECRDRLKKEGKLPGITRPLRIIELPLNATEDRVVGSFDLEEVLKHGLQKFEPGILAEANRGILYVDEINLLDDYLVDILLDAAAMGVVTVEREGVSVSYPARFSIVGSMNPEEGELRPQLLDRIALQVEVKGVHSPEARIEIIKRRKEFNANPEEFVKKWIPEQEKMRRKIAKARELLPKVTVSKDLLKTIAKICIDFNVDGHRADIIIETVARTNAAFEGRTRVTIDDIIEAAEMALPHRMRRQPFEEAEFSSDLLRALVKGEEGA